MKDNQDIEIEQMVRNRPQPTPEDNQRFFELSQSRLKQRKARKRWCFASYVLSAMGGALVTLSTVLTLKGGGPIAVACNAGTYILLIASTLCYIKSWRR